MLTPKVASNLSVHLRRRAETYLEVCRNLQEAATTTKSLKQYIGKEDDGSSGSQLIALGIALIAFPDPTVTDVLGAALIAVGLLKRKTRKIGVRDVYEEMRQAANCIKEAAEYTQINTIFQHIF